MLQSAISLLQTIGAWQAISLCIVVAVAVIMYERFTHHS